MFLQNHGEDGGLFTYELRQQRSQKFILGGFLGVGWGKHNWLHIHFCYTYIFSELIISTSIFYTSAFGGGTLGGASALLAPHIRTTAFNIPERYR